MSPQRTQAYRRVMHTLEELGPSKLQSAEQDRIRQAADTLIFSPNLTSDDSARDALRDIDELCAALIDSGRWERVTADRLDRDVHECGPDEAVAAAA
ncbi:MAG TPA: hypothetical protein VFN65_05715 [Solirubrobacteraceae bacterium]|nr:hypothetical protein [Solirubrobacteraceae bacterium]